MKKTYKLIFIVVFALIAVSILKNRPKEDLKATGVDLKEEFSKITFETEVTPKIEKKTIDFSVCQEDDGFSVGTDSGKNSIKVIGIEGEYCLVNTTFKTAIGSYSNECRVPLISGETTFTSVNFEKISQYCQIREDGSGLLNIEHPKTN